MVFVGVFARWLELWFRIGKCLVRYWELWWRGLVFMRKNLGKEFQFGT